MIQISQINPRAESSHSLYLTRTTYQPDFHNSAMHHICCTFRRHCLISYRYRFTFHRRHRLILFCIICRCCICHFCMYGLCRQMTCAFLTESWLFSQSAPECSHDLLFQTALSVGDAVFLSASEHLSLLRRIFYIYLMKNLWVLSYHNVFLNASPNFIFLILLSLLFHLSVCKRQLFFRRFFQIIFGQSEAS